MGIVESMYVLNFFSLLCPAGIIKATLESYRSIDSDDLSLITRLKKDVKESLDTYLDDYGIRVDDFLIEDANTNQSARTATTTYKNAMSSQAASNLNASPSVACQSFDFLRIHMQFTTIIQKKKGFYV